MFSSLGFRRHASEVPEMQPPSQTAHQKKQAEEGLLVVARTKHVDQIGNIKFQTQDPQQIYAQVVSQIPQQRTRGLQGPGPNSYVHSQSTEGGTVIVVPRVEVLPQVVKTVEPEAMLQPVPFTQFHAQALSQSQNEQQASLGPKSPKSPRLFKPTPRSPTEEKTSTPPLQMQPHKVQLKLRPREQINQTPQSSKMSPQQLVMVRSEVLSKAQSMAKSRLEKARFRLQGRIQQAIKLFGGKEISEAQVKKKQVQY